MELRPSIPTVPTAWGDESVRTALAPPRYLLAASCPEPSADTFGPELERLMSLKPKGARKLHWMDMSPSLRRASAKALGSLPVTHTLAVASPLARGRQERARRKCLEALLVRLEARGIGLLVLESRGALSDKRDVELLLALRRTGAISSIDVQHERGDADPLLWMPDQVLGAYGDSLSAGPRGPVLTDDLTQRIELLNVTLT